MRREEEECLSHNATSVFNCNMSYLAVNLTVLSRQTLLEKLILAYYKKVVAKLFILVAKFL